MMQEMTSRRNLETELRFSTTVANQKDAEIALKAVVNH